MPLMRAVIRPPSSPADRPSAVPVDMTVSYLSGGGAGNLPVKFRYDVNTTVCLRVSRISSISFFPTGA